MSRPTPAHAGDVRARAHIKALIEEMKEQAEGAPEPVQSFVSGMLSGLVASVEILDGGTAEGSLERMEQRLAAAIGKAYLDGKLPLRPPASKDAELAQTRAVIARLRALLPEDPADDLRAPVIVPGGLRAILDDALSLAETPRLLACGLCYEEQGEEVHPHPECPIGSAERPTALVVTVADAIERAFLAAISDRELRQTLVRRAANDVVAVIKPGIEITAGLARDSGATVQRVIALYERWVKAGPPPLGTSVSRWWDTRLVELATAINGPADTAGAPS